MKKVFKLLAVVMCAVLLASLTACGGFMPSSQVKKAVREFGTPQAEMTLTFSTSSHSYKYVIVYDLLLDKTPITTINFINLVNDGFYNDAIFESYNSSNNYFLAGRYTYRKESDDSDKRKGVENVSGITMVGEFEVNKYPEPKGGYEQFSLFSLAMYHENSAENVDSANGALIFSTASSASEINKPLNYSNYAVFARMVSIAIYEGDAQTPIEYPADKVNSLYLDVLTKQTSTTSCSMTVADGDSKSVTVLGKSSTPTFLFSIKMLGEKDWTKLPKVN